MFAWVEVRSNGSRFYCAIKMPTASEAREPDAYRVSSNRLLERTPLGSVLHMIQPIEICILSPESGCVAER